MTARSKRPTTGRVRALVVRMEDRRAWDNGPGFEVSTSVVTCALEVAAEYEVAAEVKGVGHLWLDEHGSAAKTRYDDNALEDFNVRGQAELDKYDDRKPRLWGLWIDYANVYNVDLERAERMVKVLRAVQKHLDASSDAWYAGPRTLGAHVRRGAEAIGAGALLFRIEGGYGEPQYMALSLEAGQARIDAAYHAWVARVAPQHATAVS